MTDHTTRKSPEVKTCPKCNRELSRSEFHVKRSSRDGLASACKACQAEYDRAYYAANRERAAETRRAWYARNRERKDEKARAWWKANPEKVAKYNARARAKYPERWAARDVVKKAVRYGRMPPARDLPCTVCGAKAQEYHHHLGYAPEHQMDVVAVCRTCHTELHRNEDSDDTAT